MDSPLPSKSLRKRLAKATSVFAAALTPQTISYLAQRGIDEHTARAAQLGLVTAQPGFEQYAGRLAIPYPTPGGVVTMRFRCLSSHDCKQADCPKYLGLDGPTHLYNVAAFTADTDTIGVTEGELDARVLTDRVGIPAVGVPGANAWKSHYHRLFTGFETVLVFGDGDSSGREFAARVNDSLDNGIVIPMPAGEDVTELFLRIGRDEFFSTLERLTRM